MADEQAAAAEPEAKAAPEAETDEKQPGRIARLLGAMRRQWVVAAILVLAGVNAAVFAYFKMRSGATATNEITIGTFQFNAQATPGNPITHAEFMLHISLLDDARYRGRMLLLGKRHKVQQEIEQLLRQAHGADFDDPALTELKRQLQALINKTLGQRVVAEILITELSVDRVAAASQSPADATQGSGSIWKEVEEGSG